MTLAQTSETKTWDDVLSLLKALGQPGNAQDLNYQHPDTPLDGILPALINVELSLP